jgi:hypothetical protein
MDDVGEDCECRWQALISIRERTCVGTFNPFRVDGCVDGFFDFFEVEIEGRLLLSVGASRR